jgi:hypothetical protein
MGLSTIDSVEGLFVRASSKMLKRLHEQTEFITDEMGRQVRQIQVIDRLLLADGLTEYVIVNTATVYLTNVDESAQFGCMTNEEWNDLIRSNRHALQMGCGDSDSERAGAKSKDVVPGVRVPHARGNSRGSQGNLFAGRQGSGPVTD